jgi:hypothetical protein
LSGASFNQRIASVFRKAEALSIEMVDAIECKNIEKRYLNSEELIRIMTEVYDAFEKEATEGLRQAMQKYCLQNIHLLTKINLKNDKDLAITLQQSFFEVANMLNEDHAPYKN